MFSREIFNTDTGSLTNINLLELKNLSECLNSRNLQENLKRYLVDKLSPKSICFYYNAFEHNLRNVAEFEVLRHIEKWFCLILGNNHHLELPFNKVKRICSTPGLKVTSELEVLSFADSWVKHNSNERSKFAKELLSSIRLPLLSIAALKQVLQNKNAFSNCKKCQNSIKNVIENRRQGLFDPNAIEYQNRYHKKDSYHLLVPHNSFTEEGNYAYKLQKFDQANNSRTVDVIKSDEKIHNALYDNGFIYFLVGELCRKQTNLRAGVKTVSRIVKTLKSYSVDTKELTELCQFPLIPLICVAFMKKVYVLGENSCFSIDPAAKEKLRLSNRTRKRLWPACVVHGGRIVVSGGCSQRGRIENSTEAYDRCANQWSPMPEMVEERIFHASLSIRNKIYMIGERSCEVYDDRSGVFAAVKNQPKILRLTNSHVILHATVGDKMVFFHDDLLKPCFFDPESEEWLVAEPSRGVVSNADAVRYVISL